MFYSAYHYNINFLEIQVTEEFAMFAEKQISCHRANDIQKVITSLYTCMMEPNHANYRLYSGDLAPWMIDYNAATVKSLTEEQTQLFLNKLVDVSCGFRSPNPPKVMTWISRVN